jgi:hypothetical protein
MSKWVSLVGIELLTIDARIDSPPLIPVLTSPKGAALLINDKEGDANYQDDNSDRPENNAHLEVLGQEQQDDTRSNHGVPLYKALYTREQAAPSINQPGFTHLE